MDDDSMKNSVFISNRGAERRRSAISRSAAACVLLLALVAASGCGPSEPQFPLQNRNPRSTALVNWPVPSGEKPVDNPIWVYGTLDGKMMRYYGVDDLGTSDQDEGQEPLFRLADGAVLENVILGDPAADGVHCDGSCTLRNVWWERVGEDAATFRGKSDRDTMLIEGGGASGAMDKVFQSNRKGTMIIKNFYVEWFGKLFRSCGNCSIQGKRKVIVENVTAVAGPKTESLVGLNINYGDTVEFRGKSVMYDLLNKVPVCLRYEGNNSGAEPRKLGAGEEGENCRNLARVTVLNSYTEAGNPTHVAGAP
jgi:hypothetical protein